MRRDRGTIGNIKVCVNLDSLTYGPNLQINTTDAKLAQMIVDIHRDLGLRTEPKVFHRDDTMDSAPFGAAGARTFTSTAGATMRARCRSGTGPRISPKR
jgi:hypothetical protein